MARKKKRECVQLDHFKNTDAFPVTMYFRSIGIVHTAWELYKFVVQFVQIVQICCSFGFYFVNKKMDKK